MRQLRDAVAVITGAGSGIGRALALELAPRVDQLALADIDDTGLKETCKLLGTSKARGYCVDVSDASAVESFAEQVGNDFGKASLLVNNAGVALHGTFAQLALADMEWIIKTNFWGVVYACKFFMPLLECQPEAHIVNMSSAVGLLGVPGQTAYCSSKFAVRGFTEALRDELAATNVHVTSVHPGGILTSIAANARCGAGLPPGARASYERMFEKVAQTRPEVAARIIVNAVIRNKSRVLIGSDALLIDIIQRLMPAHATRPLLRILEKRGGKYAATYLGRNS